MNINIKKIVIILVATSYFICPAIGKEIVITIPKQYNSQEHPLPPFPNEVVKGLDEISFKDELLDIDDVRWITQETIRYMYYDDFLKSKISLDLHNSHSFLFYTDIDNYMLSYTPELFNNNFSAKAELLYKVNKSIFDFLIKYEDYRLPIDVEMQAEYQKQYLGLSIGYSDYFTSFKLTPGYNKGDLNIDLHYRYDRFVMPYISLNYLGFDNYFGFASFGWKWSDSSFRLGPTIINNTVLAYLDLNLHFNNFAFNIDSYADEKSVDHLVELGYKSSRYMMLGGGVYIDDEYSIINPYLSLREDILPGSRDYRLYRDKLITNFRFYKNSFLTLVSITIQDFNNFTINVENGRNNIYNIKTSVAFNRNLDSFTGFLQIEYKVGN